jgi:hypothetical protein
MRDGLPNVINGYVMNEDGTESNIYIDTSAWCEWLENIESDNTSKIPGFFYEDSVDDKPIQLTVRYHKDRGIWIAHGDGMDFRFEGNASEVNDTNLRLLAGRIAGLS